MEAIILHAIWPWRATTMNADIRLGVVRLLVLLLCLSYAEAFYIPGMRGLDNCLFRVEEPS